MEEKNSCPKCGCTDWEKGHLIPQKDLVKMRYVSSEPADARKVKFRFGVKVFACEQCGYIELYKDLEQ